MDNLDFLAVVARIAALENFLKRLLHPEDLGHAVTQEVREEAKRILERGQA